MFIDLSVFLKKKVFLEKEKMSADSATDDPKANLINKQAKASMTETAQKWGTFALCSLSIFLFNTSIVSRTLDPLYKSGLTMTSIAFFGLFTILMIIFGKLRFSPYAYKIKDNPTGYWVNTVVYIFPRIVSISGVILTCIWLAGNSMPVYESVGTILNSTTKTYDRYPYQTGTFQHYDGWQVTLVKTDKYHHNFWNKGGHIFIAITLIMAPFLFSWPGNHKTFIENLYRIVVRGLTWVVAIIGSFLMAKSTQNYFIVGYSLLNLSWIFFNIFTNIAIWDAVVDANKQADSKDNTSGSRAKFPTETKMARY